METVDYRVLSYVAGLEFALDRLRKQTGFLRHEAVAVARRLERLCDEAAADSPAALASIRCTAVELTALLRDFDELTEVCESRDQVTVVLLRPLVENTFRRHHRLLECDNVELQLELACEQIRWFPGRLRHILDNLIGHALKSCDRSKGEMRLQVGCRRSEEGYELRVSDNGFGLTRAAQSTLLELFDRARPAHLADPVVELAVLKIIIEQTGGSLTVESMRGQGTSFVAVLPYFEMADYLA